MQLIIGEMKTMSNHKMKILSFHIKRTLLSGIELVMAHLAMEITSE